MSVTLKVVNLIDKLKVQNFFVEKDNKTYFSPIHIKINADILEKSIDKVFSPKGKAYKKNELVEQMLRDLDF